MKPSQKHLLLIFLVLQTGSLFAQKFSERLSNEISFYSSFSSSSMQSFWLTHNRFGILDDNSANALTRISSEYKIRKDKLFDIGGGIDLIARASQNSSVYLHQAYIEAKVGFFNLSVGRKEFSRPQSLGDLSSGSAAISRNAMPIPSISVYMPDFFAIPFTYGWIEFSGHFEHGWLNDDRYAKNAFFHDKSFRLQTGGNSGFKFYWGLIHIAMWGGETEDYGKLPSDLSDFIKVIFAQPGGPDAPDNEVNALGFHTGVWDWGLKAEIGRTKTHFYYQHLFTDRSGRSYQNLGDGLFGVSIENPFKTKWVSGFTYEILNTRDQSGMGLSDPNPNVIPPFCTEPNCGYPSGGRDNYYNNSIYRSGHSYYNMSIGSPFFLANKKLLKAFPDAETFENPNSERFFVSTRNLAHHFGIKGEIFDLLNYKLLTSYVEYWGTYRGLNLGEPWGFFNPEKNPEDYFFNPPQKQWYFLLESSWQLKKAQQFQFTTSIAADYGDLFNSIGFLFGVKWNLTNK
jgi:hypothetical protein